MIKLVLSDVDGTLVRSDKTLSARTIDAAHSLDDAGIHLAVTSGRPPRGMTMLVEPLALRTPIAAFNGGLLVEPSLDVLEEHVIPDGVVPRAIALLESFELSVWVYRGAEWLVRDLEGPHVAREAHTVQFEPTLVDDYGGVDEGVAKIVGVSDDYETVATAAETTRAELGDHVSAARSQPYYVDVTHPAANKGAVVKFLAQRYGIAAEDIATLGDMPNDVLMFAHSGLSIAMGNAGPDVQRAARRVTTTNDEDGFAKAVEEFILEGRS